MITYEPLLKYMEEHGISFYDLEHLTELPHGSVYNIKQGGAVTLPVLNVIMYTLNFHSMDQIIKYYRDGEEPVPAGQETVESVDTYFRKIINRQQKKK